MIPTFVSEEVRNQAPRKRVVIDTLPYMGKSRRTLQRAIAKELIETDFELKPGMYARTKCPSVTEDGAVYVVIAEIKPSGRVKGKRLNHESRIVGEVYTWLEALMPCSERELKSLNFARELSERRLEAA